MALDPTAVNFTRLIITPQITQSEADSEPRTPTPTTTFSPTSEYAKRSVPPYAHVSRHNDPDTTSYPSEFLKPLMQDHDA